MNFIKARLEGATEQEHIWIAVQHIVTFRDWHEQCIVETTVPESRYDDVTASSVNILSCSTAAFERALCAVMDGIVVLDVDDYAEEEE